MKETNNFKQYTAVYLIPWASLFAGWLLRLLTGENSEKTGALLLLASALLFGLPHGAYDFWILSDAAKNEPNRFVSVVKKSAVYLLLALLTVGIWYFLPSAALIGFLAITAWHFGSGDAIWESIGTLDWLTNSLGRGLLIISAPLAFYPKESGFILAKLNSDSSGRLIDLAPFTLAAGIALLLINNLFLLPQVSKTDLYRKLTALFEPLILVLFFWLTTPLLAVTVYLVGVHSWRHLLRINIYEQPESNRKFGSLFDNISRFHRRALPLTLVSLIGSALIFWLLQLKVSSLADNTSAYLILLSALTVPHAMFITRTEIGFQKTVSADSLTAF
jgi:beta-carotene 15,15'-dioxygenase